MPSSSHVKALGAAQQIHRLFNAYYDHPNDEGEALDDVFGDIEPGELAYMAKQVVDYLKETTA